MGSVLACLVSCMHAWYGDRQLPNTCGRHPLVQLPHSLLTACCTADPAAPHSLPTTCSIYRGQWQHGTMHGCGVRLKKNPGGDYDALVRACVRTCVWGGRRGGGKGRSVDEIECGLDVPIWAPVRAF
eukprot:354578-Chlamydomonas_euryale.AAC.1